MSHQPSAIDFADASSDLCYHGILSNRLTCNANFLQNEQIRISVMRLKSEDAGVRRLPQRVLSGADKQIIIISVRSRCDTWHAIHYIRYPLPDTINDTSYAIQGTWYPIQNTIHDTRHTIPDTWYTLSIHPLLFVELGVFVEIVIYIGLKDYIQIDFLNISATFPFWGLWIPRGAPVNGGGQWGTEKGRCGVSRRTRRRGLHREGQPNLQWTESMYSATHVGVS